MDRFEDIRRLISPFRAALYAGDLEGARAALVAVSAPDAVFRLGFPLGETVGAAGFVDAAFGPLRRAIPDLERRDFIVMAGPDSQGVGWIGCAGCYVGTFAAPWLDIPATGHFVHMRFHEYYRVEDGRIVEMQALWDISEVMMQAGVWPVAPSLGREGMVPGPARCDGLRVGPRDEALSEGSKSVVIEMLEAMSRHPSQGGPEVMEMPRFWHPLMSLVWACGHWHLSRDRRVSQLASDSVSCGDAGSRGLS